MTRRMERILLIATGALITAILMASGIVAHPAPAATQADPAPLIRQGAAARDTRAQIRERKCLPAVRYKRPFHQIRGPWRHAAVHGHRAKLARDLARPARCLPTTPIGVIKHVFPAYLHGQAISVASCETGGFTDFYNESSGASGLFQIMPFHGHYPPYDHLRNAQKAWRMYQESGWWPWLASNHCHGLL